MRIYMGYAAGVGKTYAMLNEGRRRMERGGDLVIGFVEAHGRPRTLEQIGALEVVPRRRIEHRGATFEEMDVDAILRRSPAVALVDELAHTNVVGSPHAKRWEDVEELLIAGIDVISTLNIQHLESLNDVIERITGVQQRETIPDAVVRAAEQQELVDMTPMRCDGGWRTGTCTRPRRSTPRSATTSGRATSARCGSSHCCGWPTAWTRRSRTTCASAASRVRGRRGSASWSALAGLPGDEALIRRASRMAAGRGGELIAVHVIAEDGLGGSPRLAGDSRELSSRSVARFDEVLGEGSRRPCSTWPGRRTSRRSCWAPSDRSRGES